MSNSERLGKLKDDLAVLAPGAQTIDHQPETVPQQNRGRSAERPGQIPAPGWKDILVRSWARSPKTTSSWSRAG